jgi:hypothetical protein
VANDSTGEITEKPRRERGTGNLFQLGKTWYCFRVEKGRALPIGDFRKVWKSRCVKLGLDGGRGWKPILPRRARKDRVRKPNLCRQ